MGATKNHKAYHSLKRAIERADAQPDSAVTLAGGEAVVKSASSTGVAYFVQLSVENNRELQCSCTAGRKGIICWHVVKVLQSLGATNAQLLRYMRTLLGTVGGGFPGLKAAMSRAAQSAPGSQPVEENTPELGAGADHFGGPADENEVVSLPELEISSASEAAHDQVQSGPGRKTVSSGDACWLLLEELGPTWRSPLLGLVWMSIAWTSSLTQTLLLATAWGASEHGWRT